MPTHLVSNFFREALSFMIPGHRIENNRQGGGLPICYGRTSHPGDLSCRSDPASLRPSLSRSLPGGFHLAQDNGENHAGLWDTGKPSNSTGCWTGLFSLVPESPIMALISPLPIGPDNSPH
jgi:hypothetical protein